MENFWTISYDRNACPSPCLFRYPDDRALSFYSLETFVDFVKAILDGKDMIYCKANQEQMGMLDYWFNIAR